MTRRTLFYIATLLSFGAVHAQPVSFTIDIAKKAQTMENFGASGAWYSERIGRDWPLPTKERMAELLFSKGFDRSGRPLGIGLSAWRFNIGGGSAEQGDSSGIKDAERRVESFLSPDGSYNWTKQPGYTWFVKKAVSYGVKDLIAFSNTPPVQFTKTGLAFNLVKNYETNLKEDKYGAYAEFLSNVIQHFDAQGLHFNYISPVNEPQWDWSNKFGQMNQEGSPWANKDIFTIAAKLDSALSVKKLSTRILLPEAGTLTALYEGDGHASKQIQQLFTPAGDKYTGSLSHVHRVVAGHSYFTEQGDSAIITTRKRLRDTCEKYNVGFWQSEYCMLGDGVKEGANGNISAIDCALFLAKIIHHDLVIGNATAWQFWNAWEPGTATENTRYYLLALDKNLADPNPAFSITKNLWALGHYSRFIRPGMQRVIIQQPGSGNDFWAAKNVMLSAFANDSAIVIVAINYTHDKQQISLDMQGNSAIRSMAQYVTTASDNDNLTPYPLASLNKIELKDRSIVTMVLKMK